MRKTITGLRLALYLNYKGVTFKYALHMYQHRTLLVANCTARFSQDIVHESLIYRHHIRKHIPTHLANTRADLRTPVSVLMGMKLTHTRLKTQSLHSFLYIYKNHSSVWVLKGFGKE